MLAPNALVGLFALAELASRSDALTPRHGWRVDESRVNDGKASEEASAEEVNEADE